MGLKEYLNNELRVKLVALAMNAAHDNGYSFEGWTYRQIAEDLVTIDGDLERCTVEELEPLLISWFKQSDITYSPYIN